MQYQITPKGQQEIKAPKPAPASKKPQVLKPSSKKA